MICTAIGIGLDKYTISYVTCTLTVNPAPLTITAANESKTYGTTLDRKSTRLNSSHSRASRMPSSA